MSPVEWYYARGNQQVGPVSAAELKRLAGGGEIRPDDLVWRDGLTEWAPARSVRGLFEEEAKPVVAEEAASKPVVALSKGFEPLTQPEQEAATVAVAAPPAQARHLLDGLLGLLRAYFNAHFVEATARVFRACGLYGLLAAMGFSAAFSLIVAFKHNTPGRLLSGVALLLALAALHYVAGKFCDASDQLNRTTDGSLASTAFPDCFALLCLVVAMAALLGSIAAAIDLAMYSAIPPAIVVFIAAGYLASVALNPSTLSISIAAEGTRASEEAIGVMMFLLKALLRLAPVAFGAGVIGGTLMLGVACYEASAGTERLSAASPAMAASARLILTVAAALPLAAYLVFLLCSLVLDLWRTILMLPGKFDRLSGNEGQRPK
jgi:hypothetical protein